MRRLSAGLLMLARLVLTALLASSLAACWPARFTYRPAITGTVVSADDEQPVAGATIRLVVPRDDLVPKLDFLTTTEGKFSVEPYYQWGLDSVLGEHWPAQGAVEVDAPGFDPYRQELRWSGSGTQNIGVIRLVRAR
jgi:hypothetical protein